MSAQGDETTTLRVGTRLFSSVCTTAVIVVRSPKADVELSCGGYPMLAEPPAELLGSPEAELDGGTLVTKRYRHEASGLEVVCTTAGGGTLAAEGEPLNEQGAKPLPSSD
jgi:hypothetical protein